MAEKRFSINEYEVSLYLKWKWLPFILFYRSGFFLQIDFFFIRLKFSLIYY